MRRLVLSAAALLALAGSASAADKKSWSLEPSYKGTFGPDGYFSGDASLYAGLPWGLNLDLGHCFYRSDSSSMTHTYTAGGGWAWERVAVSGSHSLTPLAADYQARAWDAGVSVDTGSEDFKTSYSARLSVIYHTYFSRIPAFTVRTDLTQRTPSLRLAQQVHGTTGEVEISEHEYNQSLAGIVNRLREIDPGGRRTGGLKGLIKGFPEYSVKVGLTQALEAVPLTLRASYQNTKLVDTGKVLPGGRVDAYKGGAELELFELLTLGGEYEHVRQTEQPSADFYGVSLSARF